MGTSITVEKVGSMSDIEAKEWNRLVPAGGFYSSHEWLISQEAVAVTYLLVRDHGHLVAGLPLYRFKTSRRPRYRELFDRDCDLVYAGPRTGNRTVLPLEPTLDDAARRDTIAALVDAARKLGVEYKYDGVIFDNVDTDTARLIGSASGSLVAFGGMDAAIDTKGEDPEACIAKLPGALRREIGRERRRFDGAGWTVSEERMADCLPETAKLLTNTVNKYGHDMNEEFALEFLSQTTSYLNELSIVFTCRDESGNLMGFCMCFYWRNELYGRVVGFDYPRLRNSFEYFNLVFYRPLEYMRRIGASYYHLGSTAIEAKAKRGATATPLWACAFFGTDPAPWQGIKWLGLDDCHNAAAKLSRAAPTAVRMAD